jgi:hypothetical protein
MAERSLVDRIRLRLRREVVVPLGVRIGGPLRRLRNSGRRYRPVFVTGAMGSGTTLLALSLSQRFECACVITESARQISPSSFLYVPRVQDFPSVREYVQAVSPRADWSIERGREDLLHLYRSYARGPGEVAIDKGPNTNLVRADFLARCFPDAHFVCVFRDPVANIEGFRRKWSTFEHDSLDESIHFYRTIHEDFFEFAERLPERVSVVEYESLVTSIDEILTALATGLGLEPARTRPRLPHRPNVPGQGIRNVRRSRIEIIGDSTRDSYRRMAPEEIGRIKEELDPLHERMRAKRLLAGTPPETEATGSSS